MSEKIKFDEKAATAMYANHLQIVIQKLCIKVFPQSSLLKTFKKNSINIHLSTFSLLHSWFNFNKLVERKSFDDDFSFSIKLVQFSSILNYSVLCILESASRVCNGILQMDVWNVREWCSSWWWMWCLKNRKMVFLNFPFELSAKVFLSKKVSQSF